jgi:membrane associated rhomboid family serine protease
MHQYQVRVRPPLRRGVTVILIVNAAIFLGELAYAYAVGFESSRVARMTGFLGLSAEGLSRGWVWQLVTHMWLHDPDEIFHILFNLMVLYFFGPDLEQRWGTRKFVLRYFAFGAGSALAIAAVGFLWPALFDVARPPTVGASGAIAGLVASYCILHWRSQLRVLFLDLSGKWLLVIFVVIDLVRLLAGSPIAVEGHWGGMLTAAVIMRWDDLHPRLLWLQFKRWRLKRRLRLRRGGKSNGDQHYLH